MEKTRTRNKKPKGAAFGMHDELVRVIGLMQESRIGGYVNHCTEAVLLMGSPDVPESRPHSRINSR